jgi:hypothetical protein
VSRKTPGGFHGFEFWMHDVCASLVFAEMIAAVESIPSAERPAWMKELLPELRVHACISDFFIPLNDWADGHETRICSVAAVHP